MSSLLTKLRGGGTGVQGQLLQMIGKEPKPVPSKELLLIGICTNCFNNRDCKASVVNIDECRSAPYFVRVQFLVSDCEGCTFGKYKFHN